MLRQVLALITAIAVAAAVAPSSARAQASEETPTIAEETPTIAFVVDVSGSMGRSRLTQAQQALRTGVDALVPGQAAGLRSFAGSCSSRGVARVPIATDNRDALTAAIDGLRAGGSTPTPGALLGAADELEGIDGPKTVVLISDGQSTCGDPCPVAESITARLGVEFRAVTVGFQAPSSAENELRCIAEVTGGEYFSADDADGIAEAINSAVSVGSSAEYVAIGDSTTTGFSVETCSEDREQSPYGCIGDPPVTPYPEHIAADGGDDVDDLDRVGIWGYTVAEAAQALRDGRNAQGPWTPQLAAARRATDLVTVSLGANDMRFSDVEFWLSRCVGVTFRSFFGRVYDTDIVIREGSCRRAAEEIATAPELTSAIDEVFGALDDAAANGAEVVVTLYFNPFNEFRAVRFAPDRDCSILHGIGDIVTGEINSQLSARALPRGFTIVDFGHVFEGRGAGANDAYVFGSDCETIGAVTSIDLDFDLGWPPVSFDGDDTKTEIQKRFDPHPNAAGTRAQADAILEALR